MLIFLIYLCINVNLTFQLFDDIHKIYYYKNNQYRNIFIDHRKCWLQPGISAKFGTPCRIKWLYNFVLERAFQYVTLWCSPHLTFPLPTSKTVGIVRADRVGGSQVGEDGCYRLRKVKSNFANLPPITRVNTVNATYLTLHTNTKNYGDVSNTLWQKVILILLFVWKIFKKNYASQALKWLVGQR